MTELKVTIVSSTKATVVDETGKSYEATISFHRRVVDGEYKYHEIYVYLNKLDEFKSMFKAPKTLRQKWKYNEETKKFRSIGTAGVRILNYTETIGQGSSRAMFDLNAIEFED